MAGPTEQPDRPEQPRKSEPISDVTQWGVLGDIRLATRRDPEAVLEPEDCRIEFSEHGTVLTLSDHESDTVYFRVYVEDSAKRERLTVSQGDDSRETAVPVDEDAGRYLRELLAEGIRQRMSVEQMNDYQLIESVITEARNHLGESESVRVGTDSGRFLTISPSPDGVGVGIGVEHMFDLETETHTTDSIIVKPGRVMGSLDIMGTEQPEFADEPFADEDAGQRERARTIAAQELGFADRELSRAEILGLLIDLRSGEVEDPES